jgi:hypothetical protein
MPPTTFEGTVKNGKIQLPDNLSLPEDTKVYVLVPSVESDARPRLRSPRLADPQKIVDFQKQVIAGSSDAGV